MCLQFKFFISGDKRLEDRDSFEIEGLCLNSLACFALLENALWLQHVDIEQKTNAGASKKIASIEMIENTIKSFCGKSLYLR